MKIALLADLKRREGDLKEFFLLRAIHMAASFLKAEAMIVCGSLCGGAAAGLIGSGSRGTKRKKHRKR